MTHHRRTELKDRTVLIPGGTGGVGEGIVKAYLAAGAKVIVPSRTQEKADRFRPILGDAGQSEHLHFVVGDYSTFSGAEDLATRISETHGNVDDVVATIGGWWGGKPVWAISGDDWNNIFVGFATAHVAILRAFFPTIGRQGAYTLILGGSAVTPVPGSGIVSMEQAALLMMRNVLEREAGDQRRVFSLVLGPVMTRHRDGGDPDWVTADQVGAVSVLLSADSTITSREIRMRSQADVKAALAIAGDA